MENGVAKGIYTFKKMNNTAFKTEFVYFLNRKHYLFKS